MNVSKLPLNQKRTIIAEKYIIAVANRISKEKVMISYINLKNHKEVLKILQDIKSGSQTLQIVEADYWDINADGKTVTNYDFSLFKDLEVKVNVNTSDKSLEILSFKNGISPHKQEMKGNMSDVNALSIGAKEVPQ